MWAQLLQGLMSSGGGGMQGGMQGAMQGGGGGGASGGESSGFMSGMNAGSGGKDMAAFDTKAVDHKLGLSGMQNALNYRDMSRSNTVAGSMPGLMNMATQNFNQPQQMQQTMQNPYILGLMQRGY